MSSVGRNSVIMASGTAASRITGQIRTILLAAALGTTGLAANAYQAGSMIPQLIYTLVSGGIFNAVLVPQIVRTLEKKNAEERLNKLITFAILLLLALTVLMSIVHLLYGACLKFSFTVFIQYLGKFWQQKSILPCTRGVQLQQILLVA